VLEAATHALVLVLEPTRLLIMFGGVLLGLTLGVIPGLGGIVGLALLIPFSYNLDAYSAFALLLGMAAVTTVSDLIPAVLFGVPGTVGAAATVLDGHPLAKKGQAARALGAGYTASLAGGIFGALLLGLAIPVLRPVVLYIGSAELLSFCIFGLAMVAVLSGNAPLRGLTSACIGLMLAMIGSDPETGTLRWTFDTLYLWDHLPLVPIALGIFALPELADMAIARKSIAGESSQSIGNAATQWSGMLDACRHWWLILRCSGLGAVLGAVPGIGSAVIDWVAYGHAVQTEKDSHQFGHGDIRGVIAAESSNNAKEGGHLIPTIAFGVPAGASMALLLSAFLMHGFIPGPEMLTKHLDVTYSIIWTLTIAHIMGVIICLCASGLFAKLSMVRVGFLVPAVVSIIYVGAFNTSQSWGDVIILTIFGIIGWVMKQRGWPRPPLILGLVLGATFERYFFISSEIYGLDMLTRPIVVVVLIAAAWVVLGPLFRAATSKGRPAKRFQLNFGRPRITVNAMFTVGIVALVVVAIWASSDWPTHAKLVPLTSSYAALVFGSLVLMLELFVRAPAEPVAATNTLIGMMDSPALSMEAGHISARSSRMRALRFFLWLVGGLGAMAILGLLPGLFLSMLLMSWIEFREGWTAAMALATGMSFAFWLLFDRIFAVPWPPSLIGDALPWLRAMTGLI
jgi:putative tricarboxylic transport membrane protein